MSVELESINGAVCSGISNGTWAAMIAAARAFEGDKVPGWNGCHDGQTWTPEQLTLMADRIEQIAKIVPTIRDCAADGGLKIS